LFLVRKNAKKPVVSSFPQRTLRREDAATPSSIRTLLSLHITKMKKPLKTQELLKVGRTGQMSNQFINDLREISAFYDQF
jgi:hypothetical protein